VLGRAEKESRTKQHKVLDVARHTLRLLIPAKLHSGAKFTKALPLKNLAIFPASLILYFFLNYLVCRSVCCVSSLVSLALKLRHVGCPHELLLPLESLPNKQTYLQLLSHQ